MELEKFIEANLENVSEWVFSCAQYAWRNFTSAIDTGDEPTDKFQITEDTTTCDGRYVSDEFQDENGSFFVDLRLQYHNGELHKHSGSSDYDQDHRGYWGVGSVEWCATEEQCREIAKDMLTDLFNEIPEGEEHENS